MKMTDSEWSVFFIIVGLGLIGVPLIMWWWPSAVGVLGLAYFWVVKQGD